MAFTRFSWGSETPSVVRNWGCRGCYLRFKPCKAFLIRKPRLMLDVVLSGMPDKHHRAVCWAEKPRYNSPGNLPGFCPLTLTLRVWSQRFKIVIWQKSFHSFLRKQHIIFTKLFITLLEPTYTTVIWLIKDHNLESLLDIFGSYLCSEVQIFPTQIVGCTFIVSGVNGKK